MNATWKFGLGIGWTIIIFSLGYYVAGEFDEANQVPGLKSQIEALQAAVKRGNDLASDLRGKLIASQNNQSMLAQRLEAAIANTPDCPVPDDVVGVLNDAIPATDRATR